MKKLLLILLGTFISYNVYAYFPSFKVMPGRMTAFSPGRYSGPMNGTVSCWFTTAGVNVPIHITTLNFTPNKKGWIHSDTSGNYLIKRIGATELFFRGKGTNSYLSTYFYIFNNSSAVTDPHAVLLGTCGLIRGNYGN